MTYFAAEAIRADRDAAIKNALDAKVPLFDIMERFGLSEAEIAAIIMRQGSGPRKPDPDAIKDARDERPILRSR